MVVGDRKDGEKNQQWNLQIKKNTINIENKEMYPNYKSKCYCKPFNGLFHRGFARSARPQYPWRPSVT